MRTITVSLAGREYSVQQLPMKANRAWREKFNVPLKKLTDALQDAVRLSGKKFADDDRLLQAVGHLLATHLEEVTRILTGTIDLMGEAVYEYAPEIAADRERIEEEAFDDELIAAFMKVVQLAFPFGPLMNLVPSLGQMAAMTSPNSPSRSGASRKMSSTGSKGLVS